MRSADKRRKGRICGAYRPRADGATIAQSANHVKQTGMNITETDTLPALWLFAQGEDVTREADRYLVPVQNVTAQPVVQKPGFSRAGMAFVCAMAFHGAMTLVCETKTRFLMPCLSSYPKINLVLWPVFAKHPGRGRPSQLTMLFANSY